jgi:hypothetical protein
MGYRNYIASIPKKQYNKIKSFTKQEMFDYYNLKPESDGEYPYKGVWEFGTQLYEFGKYVDFYPPKKSMKAFFKKKDLKEYYSEDEFNVVTKEFLAYIIGTYNEKVKRYYLNMLTPFFKEGNKSSEFLNTIKTEHNYPDNKYKFDFSKITDEEQTALFKMIEHIRSMSMEWNCLTPYALEKGQQITDSWKYEYGVCFISY